MRAMKKARQDLSREMDKQIDILYAASAVVWWAEYGWRTTRIMRRFQTSRCLCQVMTAHITNLATLTAMPGTGSS